MNSIFNIWIQPIYLTKNNPRERSGRYSLLLIPILVALFCALRFFDHKEITFKFFSSMFVFSCAAYFVLFFIFWYLILLPLNMLQGTQENYYLVPKLPRQLVVSILIPAIIFPFVALLINELVFNSDNLGVIWMIGNLIILLYTSTLFSPKLAALSMLFIICLLRSQWFIDHSFSVFDGNEITIGLSIILLNIFFLHRLFQPGRQITKKGKLLKTIRALIVKMNKREKPNYLYQLEKDPTIFDLMFLAFFRQLFRNPIIRLWNLMFLLVGLLGVLLYVLNIESSYFQTFNFYVLLFLLLSLDTRLTSGSAVLVQSKEEQGLFSLSAYAPSLQTQTEKIFKYFLRGFLLTWALNYAAFMLMTANLGIEKKVVTIWMPYIHIYFLSSLPLIYSQLKNYAKIDLSIQFGISNYYIFRVLLFAVMAGLKYYFPSIPIYGFAFVTIVVTSISVWLRYLQLSQIQAMFPVGRAI